MTRLKIKRRNAAIELKQRQEEMRKALLEKEAAGELLKKSKKEKKADKKAKKRASKKAKQEEE